MIEFYREPYVINSRRLTKRKLATTIIKTAVLITYPIPAVWLAVTSWYLIFFQNHIHLSKHAGEYVYAGFIPAFMIGYSIITGLFFSKAVDEYKQVRLAVKRYDLQTFMDLRDEDISPLAHALMTIFALFIIGAFSILEYHTWWEGALLVGSSTYVLSFTFFVIREIDDPFEGIWFIKYIHPEWMEIDCKKWREEHYKREREKHNISEVKVPTKKELAEAA